MTGLFWRAAFAFLALPGLVAFAVPLLIVTVRRDAPSIDAPGLVPLAAGSILLLACVREFYVAGRGTLAPWSPPQELVTTGLYRFSRNPMYLSVMMVLLGWAAAFRSETLAVYALAVSAAFHLRVVFAEEPWLARTHGEKWVRYKAEVPRWFGFHRLRTR